MTGGVAVRANLLCVTWSAALGHVFLFDLEARQRVSAWSVPAGGQGYSDAGGVAMDEHFHLFVADPHNNRVCHFSAFGRHLGDLGAPAPAAGDVARDRPGVLDRPHAVAVAGDTVVVAAGDKPRRCAVQCFSRNGTVLRRLWSGGDVEATFGAPRAIWVDADGVLVADTLRGRVQRFRADGTFVSHLACAPAGAVARPIAVLRLPGGTVLVADRGDDPGIRALQPDGVQLPIAAELNAHCVDALAFAADAAGRIYVLDRGGERVLRFDRELRFDQVVVDLPEHLGIAPGAPGQP
ncbi:MAG TPA: hypothetical protein VF384_04870 [Planctomycetota bacterium]